MTAPTRRDVEARLDALEADQDDDGIDIDAMIHAMRVARDRNDLSAEDGDGDGDGGSP